MVSTVTLSCYGTDRKGKKMFRTCIHCGKQLPRNRTWRRKYCNAQCRVAYNRKKDKPLGYADAMQAIGTLGNAPKANQKYAIQALKDLKRSIDFELHRLGDADTIEKFEMFKGLNK